LLVEIYLSLLKNAGRYKPVRDARSLDEAISAIGKSGYATDPNYSAKLSGIAPSTESQTEFLNARRRELMEAGAPPHIAELGARQSALETNWGKSLSGGNNYYGIKARRSADVRTAGVDEMPYQMQRKRIYLISSPKWM
jgi:flagellum-specific peptidoglycan hydrolase FlgJ